MTITEFLLARIAEDERIGRDWQHNPGKVEIHGGGTGYYGLANPERILAECQAKRAIIEQADEATGLDMQVDGEFRVGRRDETTEPYLGDVLLRALAAVYADHPDYDQAWRVEA